MKKNKEQTQTSKQKEPCPACGGTGYKMVVVRTADGGRDVEPRGCEECGGEGVKP